MNHRQWRKPVSYIEACKWAAGGAKHNKAQKDEAEQRLPTAAELLCKLGIYSREMHHRHSDRHSHQPARRSRLTQRPRPRADAAA
jgi:hypothetical protein